MPKFYILHANILEKCENIVNSFHRILKLANLLLLFQENFAFSEIVTYMWRIDEFEILNQEHDVIKSYCR